MSDFAVRVENLGKKYRLSHHASHEIRKYTALRDVMAEAVTAPFRALWRANSQTANKDHASATSEDFWALKDVSFDIKQGEVVGIIGRNGAGKSTLLKILSRITDPTTGRVEIEGRVASLLEVGTGFHPELTGRENIYLNGTILGMKRAEIKKKFDEIVAFAEVGKFLDTPVKHFSSGMYVRLAFAVAAHLEPEILIVDEVLAVGDVEFQKKCLGKMQDVAKGGRTVLFVSHNMEAIDRLTSRCLLLKSGRVSLDCNTAEAVKSYLHQKLQSSQNLGEFRSASIPGALSIAEVWTETLSGEKATTFRQGEPFRIFLRVTSEGRLNCDFAVVIENFQEHALYCTHLSDLSQTINTEKTQLLTLKINNPMLRKGEYLVSLAALSSDRAFFYDVILHYPLFEIAGVLDTSFPDDVRWGDLYMPIEWKVENGA
jgi:lipopolysaccharide transport system ATP-binding protein